jgi:hypothetical protein
MSKKYALFTIHHEWFIVLLFAVWRSGNDGRMSKKEEANQGGD